MPSAEWFNKTQEEIKGAFAAATEKPRKGPKAGYKAPIKYRGPNGETWTGRGRLVKWIKDSGKDKSEFKIQ